jgi:hypothetical protein
MDMSQYETPDDQSDDFDPDELYDAFPSSDEQGFGRDQGFNTWIQLNDPELFTEEARHHPVIRWVKPDEFVQFQTEAEKIGFAGVLAGPLVRSSYRAGRLYQQAVDARGLSRAR